MRERLPEFQRAPSVFAAVAKACIQCKQAVDEKQGGLHGAMAAYRSLVFSLVEEDDGDVNGSHAGLLHLMGVLGAEAGRESQGSSALVQAEAFRVGVLASEGPGTLRSRSIRKLRIHKLRSSGKFLMDLGIPPLRIKNLLESNPLESRFLVRTWTAIPFRFPKAGRAVDLYSDTKDVSTKTMHSRSFRSVMQ